MMGNDTDFKESPGFAALRQYRRNATELCNALKVDAHTMSRASAPTPNSSQDHDGVRIVRTSGFFDSKRLAAVIVVLALVALGIVLMLSRAPATTNDSTAANGKLATAQTTSALSTEPRAAVREEENMSARRPTRTPSPWAPATAADERSLDANDIASYVSPGDPEPTMAEVIDALRASGEHGGLAAFNPPGTSPPLQGLAVPEDYVLPEGYVRHHQVTDDGQVIEAILMFSPDYVLRDAAGQIIPIPEDRVVTPELAPADLPLRPIVIPAPE